MIDLANAFILFLLGGAAWLGVSALVQRRHVRQRQREHSSTNLAS